MRILVTDGDNRAALAVTRSLGRAGHEVIVGASHLSALAQASRYCVERVSYPDPIRKPDRFIEAVIDLASAHRAGCIVPIADITTFMITAHRHRFEPRCSVPFAAASAIERAADKIDILDTAAGLGLPVPRGVVVPRAEAVPDHDIPFPLVVKPWRSRIRTAGGWESTSVSYAATPAALERDLRGRGDHEFPVMLQERIEGPGIGVFACYRAGRPVALFSHRRLRERPPWGGVSVLCESVAFPNVAGNHAIRLLNEIGWCGVAMVEFKVDGRDNQPKLMEVNGRFWGSLQLAIDAGVDFPRILVEPATVEVPEYRTGVRNRWLWGDVDALLQTMHRWDGPADRRPPRANAFWQFMKWTGSDLHYDNPKWDDPWPFAVETAQRLGVVAGRVLSIGEARRPARNAAILDRAAREVRVRAVTSLKDVGLDARGWNALVASADTNTVFQTHQWTQSWLETFDNLHDTFLLVAETDGGATAVAPLMFNRNAGRLERTVSFIGSGRADYCDFVAPRTQPELLRALLDSLLDHPGWDIVDLTNIPAGSSTIEAVRTACQERGLLFAVHDQYRCPTLMIEGREEEARAVLRKPSLRRCRNRFERAGKLTERDLTAARDIEPRLPQFFQQHIARWSGSPSPSLFHDERNQQFYRTLTRALDASGWLLFSCIELDGRTAAFHYGFDYNGSVLWYKPSFDPPLAALSPGNVMVSHLIDYTISKRRRELDFTVGDEPFKRRFTNATRRTVHLRVYRNTMVQLRSLTRQVAAAAAHTIRGSEGNRA